MIERDAYEENMLSMNIEHAQQGSAKLERVMAGLFGFAKPQRWTRSFEAAVKLFEREFGRGNPTWETEGEWNRECFANGCNGISWMLSRDDEHYHGSGETDALSLCAAMVMAKRKEKRA
jgi:hypothetical protein